MRKFFLHMILAVSLCGCIQHQRTENASRENGPFPHKNSEYAEKFNIITVNDQSLLQVYSPWQNSADAQFNYMLGKDPKDIPDTLSNLPFIKIPVERVVIMSTTFIGFLENLGVSNTIKGISGGRYIYKPELFNRYQAGEIREVGYDQQINYELLIDLDPDVVFFYGVESGIVQTIQKLQEMDIPAVMVADYLESHPLGRSEWIRFFASFYDLQELADSVFHDVTVKYDSIASLAKHQSTKPEVLLGLPWKDTWYIAGGNSFAAKLISDAGGKYIFDDQAHSEAKPFDIESVFSRAMGADIWINPGIAGNLDDITDHDQRFSKLEVYRNGSVFNNNRRLGSGGGNDYWESGVMNPHIILDDLFRIFHNHSPDENDLFYYRQMN